ncbi:hypothetical protein PT287_08340 [Lactobacillus sp. ESL0679]|uniref:hypothetical protein n=1 Tax=Lactobacillus sp. ESL0679 TaxID=2983209 RepID=UPI0023FA2627|nr:hypothetical protein [Lactobacillus sp. ESL0679]MDF7683506.1 hypothetical protein [Lactobacillus sp. ESL0679]
MWKSRIKRNKGSILFGLLIVIILFACQITPKKINNYTDVISGILSMASIATSFLFASFSLIPALPDSKLMKSLKELGTDKKLLDRLLITMFGFFVTSILALLALVLFQATDNSMLGKTIISFLGGFLCFSLAEQFKILRILLKALEKM